MFVQLYRIRGVEGLHEFSLECDFSARIRAVGKQVTVLRRKAALARVFPMQGMIYPLHENSSLRSTP